MIVNPDVDVHTRDGADRKFVPAVRTASAASVRTASAFVVHYLSASALHRNPKVLPPISNGNLRPLTWSTVLLITFFSGCKVCL